MNLVLRTLFFFCGYVMSYRGADILGLRAVRFNTEELIFYFWLLERSRSEVAETE